MYRQRFNSMQALRFKHFTRRSYALFSCIGREVLICTLSVATLTYAKADGVSTKPVHQTAAADTLGHEEVKLDEVLVTGSRAPLTALQSAKIVSVITRDDIQRAEAASVNDLLKLATGVDVRQRGGFGVQTDISINGGTFDQITILLNGVNISSPQKVITQPTSLFRFLTLSASRFSRAHRHVCSDRRLSTEPSTSSRVQTASRAYAFRLRAVRSDPSAATSA